MTARAEAKPAEDWTVLVDPAAVAEAAAQWLVERVGAGGAVCLSGGSTPRLLYQRLALPPYRDRLPWPLLHWFWGDERFVPPDDPRSNCRMARLALFDHVPAPPANLHPIPSTGSIEDAAAAYEKTLRDFAASRGGAPLFDASLLGLGPDGHTASLFPGAAALDERARWVRAVPEGIGEPRITLTFPALARSAEIAFLVDGVQKRDILTRIRGGADLPAARIRAMGRTRWFVDRAALGTERR
jgi:6-phosphogluconolactonase